MTRGAIALVAALFLIIVLLIAFMFFLVLRQPTQKRAEKKPRRWLHRLLPRKSRGNLRRGPNPSSRPCRRQNLGGDVCPI